MQLSAYAGVYLPRAWLALALGAIRAFSFNDCACRRLAKQPVLIARRCHGYNAPAMKPQAAASI